MSCLLVLAAALSVAACSGGSDTRKAGPGPAPGPAPTVSQSIPVGGSPAAVAAGLGGVWVADNLRGRLVRVAPDTRRVAGHAAAGNGPIAVAVGSGAVWVAGADSTVRRYDSRTGVATGEPERVPDPGGVAVGEGSVWVTSRTSGTVTRLDPKTGRRRGRAIKVGPEPTDIAVGGGAVWVANSKQMNGTVSRIDPKSGTAGKPIKVAKEQVLALTYGENGVWVATTDEVRGDKIEVERIDPGSSRPEGDIVRLDRPGLPVRLAAGGGAVWVAQAGGTGIGAGAGSGTVARLDPARRRRVGASARLPGPPAGVSVGESGVWVATSGTGELVRVGPADGTN